MTVSVLCSARAEVAFPSQDGTVRAASFLPSALRELGNRSTYVLFDEQGLPYGFVENGTFADSINYGNLTVLPGTAEDGVVVGGSSLGTSAEELARLRTEQGTAVDWEMLRQEDFLDYAYYSQRYGSLENFLRDGMGIGSQQEAADFMNSLDTSQANELRNIFEALEDGGVGYSHYKEVLDALEGMDMEGLRDQLDPEQLRQVEEFLDTVKEQAARRALDEILKNVGEDELKLLWELLKHLDYGTIYEIARDYVREMARDGTLDQIGEHLQGMEIPQEARESFTSAASEFVRNRLGDYLPKNASYYLLAAAFVATAWSLRRVGG